MSLSVKAYLKIDAVVSLSVRLCELYGQVHEEGNAGLRMTKANVIGISLAAAVVRAGHAAPCYKSGDTVAVTGTIHMRTLPADEKTRRLKPWTYPAITSDHPVCLKSTEWGDVRNGTTALVLIFGVKRELYDEQHVSLRGQLSPRTDRNQPEELMLSIMERPADAPDKDETILATLNDAVADHCAKNAKAMAKDLGSTILRVVVTKSPRWGTIWRADTSDKITGGYPPILSRTVCWKGAEAIMPLNMFDPAKNIPPLQ